MFIKEIISEPRIVDGRTFIEKTLKGIYKGTETYITTIYMDGKPIVKQYTFDGANTRTHYWKSWEGIKHRIPPLSVQKKNNLDILA